MKVKQIHKNIGVSIEGIDLSRIDNKVFQQIKDLWLKHLIIICLLYTSPSPRDKTVSRMPSSA